MGQPSFSAAGGIRVSQMPYLLSARTLFRQSDSFTSAISMDILSALRTLDCLLSKSASRIAPLLHNSHRIESHADKKSLVSASPRQTPTCSWQLLPRRRLILKNLRRNSAALLRRTRDSTGIIDELSSFETADARPLADNKSLCPFSSSGERLRSGE